MADAVIFSPEAQQDLFEIYDFIAEGASPERALHYTERLIARCNELVLFPEQGTPHDDIRFGLRTIVFQRRVLIGYHQAGKSVVIDRLLYGGREVSKAFDWAAE